MSNIKDFHNRLICVSVTHKMIGANTETTYVKRSQAVKLQSIRRHVDVHELIKDKTAAPNKYISQKGEFNREGFEKMNHAYTIKTACQLYPSYSINQQELAFLYLFGEIARLTGINPLRYLLINRKTRANSCHSMKEILLSEIKTLLKKQTDLLKKQNVIQRVMSLTLDFDHAFAPSIKCHIGCFTLSIRIYDESKKETVEYFLPLKTFELNGKGDQTAERNAYQILKVIEETFELKSSVAVAGDGAIVIPSLFKELKKRCETDEHDLKAITSMIFICMCHYAFLIYLHGFKNTMDDVGCVKFPSLFPNYSPKPGKKLFFFGDEAEKSEMEIYLPYFLNILNNLDTQSTETAIRLTDYITGIQRKILKESVKKQKKDFSRHADKKKFEDQLLQDINNQFFTSSDPFEMYKARFFGESIEDESKILKPNPLKVGNDPGKKSRRMINMETSLVKTIRFADCVVRNHFDGIISKPTSPIPNRFSRNMAEHSAIARHIVALADSSKANNITMYRILCILSKAALKLDDTDDRLHEDILSNPLIG